MNHRLFVSTLWDNVVSLTSDPGSKIPQEGFAEVVLNLENGTF